MSIVKNTPNYLKHSGLSFTTLINKTIESIQNPATLGIYVYLASKNSDWEISETNLKNRFKRGRDFIRDRMAELKKLGLLKTYSVKDEKGKILYWETVLFNEIQITENPHTGKPRSVGKPPTTNKGFKEIKEIKEINKTPISPAGKKDFFSLSQMLEDNPFNLPANVLSDWLEVRKGKRAKITETAWKQVNNNLKKLKEFGLEPNECFLKAVASGWSGIEVRYFKQDIEALKPETKKYPATYQERINNEKQILQREKEAAQRKQDEIEASKNFKGLVNEVKRRSRKEIEEEQESNRLKMNMTVMEYSAHVLNQAKKTHHQRM